MAWRDNSNENHQNRNQYNFTRRGDGSMNQGNRSQFGSYGERRNDYNDNQYRGSRTEGFGLRGDQRVDQRSGQGYWNQFDSRQDEWDQRDDYNYDPSIGDENYRGGNYGSSGYGSTGYGSRGFQSPYSREGMNDNYGYSRSYGMGASGRWGRSSQDSNFGSESYGRGSNSGSDGRGYTGSDLNRFTGKGPKGYKRSKDRIEDDVNETLMAHPEINCEDVTVTVMDSGEVKLTGTCEDRRMKRMIEDVVENISGVKDVQNDIKIQSTFSDTKTSSMRDKGSVTGSSKTSEKTASH